MLGPMVRPFVPVLGPLPAGSLPTPVSPGTNTPRRTDVGGAGNPASETMAAEWGGGPVDREGPHAPNDAIAATMRKSHE
jgi:hypothetical protein